MTAHAAETTIEALIAEVRRTLWLGQLQRAVRAALWCWAVIMTGGAILHALTGRPGLLVTLAAGGAAWLVALVVARLQRPETETAALHADRRLGGQSAYSTWLEARSRESLRPATHAARHLSEWAAAEVPAVRVALARQRPSWQLLRPAAAAVICTAIAIAVAMLGSSRRTPEPARDVPAASGGAAAEAPMLDESALAETLATELAARNGDSDTANARSDPEPSTVGRAAASAPADAEAIAGDAGTAERLAGAGVTSTPDGRREAGSSLDDSAPGAHSRAAGGPLIIQRRDLNRSTDDGPSLANDERVASYADEPASGHGQGSGVHAAAAAARAPSARGEARLTPAEAAYVARWRTDSQSANQEQR